MSEQMVGIVLAGWVLMAGVAGVGQRRRQQDQSRPRDYAVWHPWPGTYQEPESKFEYPMSGRD